MRRSCFDCEEVIRYIGSVAGSPRSDGRKSGSTRDGLFDSGRGVTRGSDQFDGYGRVMSEGMRRNETGGVRGGVAIVENVDAKRVSNCISKCLGMEKVKGRERLYISG